MTNLIFHRLQKACAMLLLLSSWLHNFLDFFSNMLCPTNPTHYTLGYQICFLRDQNQWVQIVHNKWWFYFNFTNRAFSIENDKYFWIIMVVNALVQGDLHKWRPLLRWFFVDSKLKEISKNLNTNFKTSSKVMLILRISRMWLKNQAISGSIQTNNFTFFLISKCSWNVIRTLK